MKKCYASQIAFMVFFLLFWANNAIRMQVQTTATIAYPPYAPSTCAENAEWGNKIIRLGSSLWNGGMYCGKILTVSCNSRVSDGATTACKDPDVLSVDATIVGVCEGCEGSTFELSKEAFDVIAYEDAGPINVGYLGK